jgi:hypothetical protein
MPSLPAWGTGAGLILRGKRIGLRGNRRNVRRQYAARKWGIVRVLPGIAGYCRVVGMWEKKGSPRPKVQSPKFGEEHGGSLGERALPSYRVVPAGTAWDRLGPDKFFSQAEPAPNVL